MWAILRAEDWLIVGWVAVATPLLNVIDGGGSGGPFDPGHPVEGAVRLLAVLGALACLVTRSSDVDPGREPGVLERGAVGPLTGGLLLVGASGASGLGLSEALGWVVAIVAVVLVIIVRLRWPVLPTMIRRALVTPFVLAAGGIFWNVINSVVGNGDWRGSATGADLQTIALVAGVLLAFAGVYYAMLVYAPRQVADAEGGPKTWLVRFGLFAVSLIFGLAWLRPFGA